MTCSVNINELFKIVNAEHQQPHSILGMHEININNSTVLAVRVFSPCAKGITVIDIKNTDKKYEMIKIHEDGFFEVIIKNRKKWFPYKLCIQNYDGSIWETYDSYSFAPTISEYDRYLFNAGTHYEIYKKLGAHIMTIDGVEGVGFGVWAPNAKSVSVIGDFNQWDGRRNPMRMLGESGIWELFIPGLKQYDKYKFHIKTQQNDILLKTDPYGFFNELRPATASMVFDIENYTWNDQSWFDQRNPNNVYNGPMNIYEVHLGSWKHVVEDGDRPLSYVELADELIKYVKEMGYNYIELMPVTEHPFDGSWGYQVTGYFAPTSRYGNPLEFKYFVDKCHENGIGVIMDWVPAHFPKDSHGLARFDGTSLYEHMDPRQGEHPDWGTLIYNYGRNEVKNFLISNAMFWIEEYHIDGLRVDAVASMLYLDYGKKEGQWVPNERGGNENLKAVEFLKHMNSIISKKHPSTLMIAEESTAWPGISHSTEYGGLGFSMKWNMGWMNDFLKYMSEDPIYRKYDHYKLTFSMVYAYSENFVLVLSHDEVVHGKGSLIGKMPGDIWQKFANLRLLAGMMYGHPGKKLIFMGGEFGQFSEWSESRSLDWHLLEFDNHKNTQNYFKTLNKFYLSQPALWERDFSPEGFRWIDCNDMDRSIVSYVRYDAKGENMLVFVCNFTPNTYFEYRLGVPLAGDYEEVFNSDSTQFGGSGVNNTEIISTEEINWHNLDNSINIKLPPLGVVVFKQVQKN